MLEALALWFPEKELAALKSEILESPADGQCEIKALYSAISPGTERLIFCGQIPVSQYETMRCLHMGGRFPFPVKYGYSLVGKVENGPEHLRGKTVHVMHPHQNRCVVKSRDVFPVPDEVPSERATLASNMETAVNAVWDARILAGERVIVVGFGIVGSLIARLASFFPGCEIVVAERDAGKRELASQLGFSVSGGGDENGFDLAFHCSASDAGLQTAIDAVGFEGRVVETSWYGSGRVTVDLGGDFHSKRKILISSQVSSIPGARRMQWDFKRRKNLVFELLKRPEFDEHITEQLPFESLPQAYPAIRDNPTDGLARLVAY